MSLEALLQALGAKDENEGLRNAMRSEKVMGDLMTMTGTRTVDEALAFVTANVKLIGSLETLTGKKGDEITGVATAWKGSHEQLPGVQKELAETGSKLETLEVESMIGKAKADNKLDKAGEDKLRGQLADKTFTVKQASAMLDMMHPIPALANAKNLQQPAPIPAVAGAGAGSSEVGGGGIAPATFKGKKYEEYTADEMSAMRTSSEITKDEYATLRSDWERRNKPQVKKAA